MASGGSVGRCWGQPPSSCMWEVEDQLENIPEPSPAGIRITIEGQVQYNQSL